VFGKTYWATLFTPETWAEFVASGGKIAGFPKNRWNTVKQMAPGDVLICYLTGVSQLIGVLDVTGEPFWGQEAIWSSKAFRSRVPVTPRIMLDQRHGVPISSLKNELSIFTAGKSPRSWTTHVRRSPTKWPIKDGERVVQRLEKAAPVPEPVELSPEPENPEPKPPGLLLRTPKNEASAHLHIQWQLAKLGNDLGLEVWVARNDRSREIDGRQFSDLEGLLVELPVLFEPQTRAIIEMIDVIWLKGPTIVAAFEIENSTSVYSGLLRMSDLVTLQPNLSIPLFLVAPDARRKKVMREINRPTFSGQIPCLSHICRFISFERLRNKLAETEAYIHHLNPSIIFEFSESCHHRNDPPPKYPFSNPAMYRK